METTADRLRRARIAAGFATIRDAAAFIWESLGSPSSELIFGAAFLSFMGGASLVKGEAEIYSVLVLLVTAALATAGYVVRGKERQAAAQIARDKAAAEASPPPS